MRELWLRKNSSKKLVLFFSGFASNEKLLQNFKDFADADFLMLCDYRSLDFPSLESLNFYEDIAVVAWSFGAWVANYFREKIKNTSSFTCINASPFAVDNELGISNTTFKSTCETFSDSTKEKFFLRTCIDRNYYQEFRHFLSDASGETLKAELDFLAKTFAQNQSYLGSWDRAIISSKDKIFVKNTLLKVFPNPEIVEGAHFNLSLIYSTLKSVANRSLEIKQSFENHIDSYQKNAKAQEYISQNLSQMGQGLKPKKILELGAGTGFLTKCLSQNFPQAEFFINDLSELSCKKSIDYANLKNAKIYAGDLMLIDFKEHYDAIFSASCFQWIQNQKSLYKKLHSLLNTNGSLSFSTFSKNNLKELKKFSQKSLNYLDQAELVSLLNSLGFQVLESKTESIEKTFASPIEVLRHLKSTGVNATFKSTWTKKDLRKFSDSYEQKDGNYLLTYEAIYIKAKKI